MRKALQARCERTERREEKKGTVDRLHLDAFLLSI